MADSNSRICYFFIMDVSRFNHGDTFKNYYNMVPAYRRDKIDALKPASAKNLSLGVGVLLEEAKNRLGLKDDELSSVEDVEREAPFYYNLSHSGQRALCALSDVRIGCDVEKIETDEARAESKMSISGRFFSEGEARRIKESFNIEGGLSELEKRARMETAAEGFYRYWTLKESVIKVTGQGLAMPLDSFEVDISGSGIGLKEIGDWPGLHDIDLGRCRLYVPYTEEEYAYGLCIASPEEYSIELEIVG
ncbi:MAG: 4'-phosphopantetheinyl transferase superfamily protein [Lachnospiraceae bacterium]|nr:4'-phosphopantetheinyl transferase superfamily protein [Lachnospiraceae bacterium]